MLGKIGKKIGGALKGVGKGLLDKLNPMKMLGKLGGLKDMLKGVIGKAMGALGGGGMNPLGFLQNLMGGQGGGLLQGMTGAAQQRGI